MSSGLMSDWPLVGRGTELALITRLRSSGSSGIVLAGPAGVGKSRLAREALSSAETHGAVTRWTRATQSAATVPLGAFASVIPDSAHSEDPLELLRRSAISLRGLAGSSELVLGVDDAHLLDHSSAALVLELTLSGAAFVVATVRSGDPCPDAIVSVWKDAGAARLELKSLSREETEAFAEEIVGGPIEQAVRRWIFDTTLGNALYVRELVLGVLSEGALQCRNGLWQIWGPPPFSASLLELITARLTGLADDERHALELLALGEPLRASEMISLVGGEVLAGLQARGLVQAAGRLPDLEVSLSHPLYGEAIRAGLGSLRARATRIALASVVQERSEPEERDSLRVARWLLDAGEEISTSVLIDAARAANLSGDPQLAVTLAKLAVDAGAGVTAALLLSRAYTIQNQHEEAAEVLASAESAIDTQECALDYLEQQVEVLYFGLHRSEELLQLLTRAEMWWDSEEWHRRLAPLRLRTAFLEPPETALRASSQILAESDLDPEVRRRVAPKHVATLFYSGRVREALELAESIRPSVPLRDFTDELAYVLWCTVAVESGDHWVELRSWAETEVQEAVRHRDRAAAGRCTLTLGALSFMEGRYLDATRWLAEAELQLGQRDAIGLLLVTQSMRVGVACFTGDVEAIEPALERCRATLRGHDPFPNQLPYLVRAEAWAAYGLGDPPRAQSLLLAGAERVAGMPVYDGRLSYEAMRLGAPARRVAARLESVRRRCDSRLTGGLTAHAIASADGDGSALLQAVEELEAIGALRYATEAAADAANAFARAGRKDSARRAAARCRELHARGQGGFEPPIEEIDGVPASLTARERQLATLAARGLSNTEIAEALRLSRRTVESHLYRAMQKLGVRDRSELRDVMG